MGRIQRWIVKSVITVVTYPKSTLLIAGILLAVCVGLALTRLSISTDQNKLFNPKVPFFRDYLEFSARFPENEAIYVVLMAKDPGHPPATDHWTSVADAVGERLKRMPEQVEGVDVRTPMQALGEYAVLFENTKDLPETFGHAKELSKLVKLWAEKPDMLTSFLGRTPTERFLAGVTFEKPETTAGIVEVVSGGLKNTVTDLKAPLVVGPTVPDMAAIGATSPRALGYGYVADETNPANHLLLIGVKPKRSFDSLTAISETVDAIRDAAKDAGAKAPYGGEFDVVVTGRPALEADEMRTSDRDTKRAEIIAAIVVFLGLNLMFAPFSDLRSHHTFGEWVQVLWPGVWLSLVAEIVLTVAVGWTVGWASLAVGELNLLSLVFVIALIGIGMDYLIQILSRYRREVRRYERASGVWVRVFRYVSPPVSTACMGAAGAFFASVFTDFRGAAELGIIAGGGLLLCLVAGYTVLPALLVLFPAKLKMREATQRYSDDVPPPRVTVWYLGRPAIWMLVLLAALPLVTYTSFNSNLLDLQAPGLESVKVVEKLQTWYEAVPLHDLKTMRKVREALLAPRPADPKQPTTIESTDSLLDAEDNYRYLQDHKRELPVIAWADPGPVTVEGLAGIAGRARALARLYEENVPAGKDAAGQALAAAANLRAVAEALAHPKDAAAMAARLTEWQGAYIGELHTLWNAFSPPPLDVTKLPGQLRNHLVSIDPKDPANRLYALYIKPNSKDLWNAGPRGAFLAEIDRRLSTVQAPAGERVYHTGIASDIDGTTISIRHAFELATVLSLGLIFVLVLVDLRSIGLTLIAISVLALGLPMLLEVMGAMDIHWNFANFFALPILIGAGHEYGVFMVHRYREVLHNPRRVWRVGDVSDRALLLCAFVTTSSFAFLILGQHRGIRSLGLVMALGTACIYTATIFVVRPLLLFWLYRKKRGKC